MPSSVQAKTCVQLVDRHRLEADGLIVHDQEQGADPGQADLGLAGAVEPQLRVARPAMALDLEVLGSEAQTPAILVEHPDVKAGGVGDGHSVEARSGAIGSKSSMEAGGPKHMVERSSTSPVGSGVEVGNDPSRTTLDAHHLQDAVDAGQGRPQGDKASR